MVSVPTIKLQSIQAESMIQAARQFAEANEKQAIEQTRRHFENTAITFFKTTNDTYVEKVVTADGSVAEKLKTTNDPKKPNVISNALIALFTEIRKAENECPTITTKTSKSLWDKIFTDGMSVKEFLISSIENSSERNPELNKEVNRFINILENTHPKSYENRINVARTGMVRANEVHKPAFLEKLSAIYHKFINVSE